MPDTADAVLQDHEGRPMLRFERVLEHPPERVWKAMIEPVQLSAWHPTPFELEPVKGGLMRYIAAEGSPAMPDGTVIEFDPPRVLAYTWGEDQLRWELLPHGDGCLLVLTHTFDDRLKAARDAAGWHLCLDQLSCSLDGEQTSQPQQSTDGLPLGWRELNREYEGRFGIAPDKATPPPPQ
jgi:uncharacterized protein YndB with AHSA1/START domain